MASLVGQKGADGADGKDGKSAYEIAVEHGFQGSESEWLESLKGTGSATGSDGKDGKSAYEIAVENGFVGSAAEWLESLKGPAGQNGKSAYQIAVDNGFEGTESEWLASLAGETGAYGKDGKSAYELAQDNGFQGSLADWLESLIGKDGKDGKDGQDGKDGKDGINGLSAYELAVQNGYEGSLTEWLASLIGKNGADGKSAYDLAVENGYVGTLQEWLATLVGAVGEDGKSAYDIAVEHGYKGTESEWLASLTGKEGKSAYDIAVEYGYTGTEEEWLASLAGKDGQNGNDGTSVSNAYVNSQKHLILVLSNGNEINAGYVGVTDTPSTDNYYTVVFKDYDGTVLKTEVVIKGGSATAPAVPTRDGYVFSKWDKSFDNVTGDITVTAQYERITSPTIVVGNVSAKAGDTIQVPVSIQNNPGILGMALKISFDDSVMTLTGAATGEAVSDVLTFTRPKNLINGCKFAWDGLEITPEQTKDGDVLILTFEIQSGAETGSYPISFTYSTNDVFNNDMEPVALDMVNGNVTIQ